MKRLLALFLILVGSILPSRLTTAIPKVFLTYSEVARYNVDRCTGGVSGGDLLLTYYDGQFGYLVMIGFGITSIILALVAIQVPTRRLGWVIALIVCVLLAIGSFVLKIWAANHTVYPVC
jgi:uncharacterized membrane protein